MKIGIVTTWFERGAAYVSRQFEQALNARHQVFIYARGEHYAHGDPVWDRSNVTWGKRGAVSVVGSIDLADFERWIRRNALDAVFFNEQRWWEPILLCNEMSVKTGAYVDYYTEDTLQFFGCYDFLICNTRRHASAFDWHPQAFYVPWGTNVGLFRPASCDPVKPGVVTFFHSAGRNPYRKGADKLLRAFDSVSGPARLIIHTQIPLDQSVPEVTNLAEKLASAGRLECVQKTVPAPGLYHLGDVYAYPARLDGIGLTIAEALACGLPAIVPDAAPFNEFVDHTNGRLIGVARFFCRSDGYYWPQCEVRVDHLTECLQWYVTNLERIGELRLATRRYAETNLNWQENARELPDLFNRARLLPAKEKARVASNIRRFEHERLYHSWRGWMAYNHPNLVRALRAVRRTLLRT